MNSKLQEHSRKVSALLGLGIFLLPLIFVWFTLRSGYSKLSRVISFAWLILLTFLAISTDDSSVDNSKNNSSNQMISVSEPIVSVDKACSMLNLPGMTQWHDSMGNGTYRCISTYIDISPESKNTELPNNLAYYVQGTKNNVTELKIVLNVNDSTYKKRAESEFIKLSNNLYNEITNQEIPKLVKAAIKSKKNYSIQSGSLLIKVESDKWENENGYSQTFIITE